MVKRYQKNYTKRILNNFKYPNSDSKNAQTPIKKNECSTAENIEKFGTQQLPTYNNSNIHCISIIGQIEGHLVLPPQNKATKYEHIIPQLIAIEENKDIQGLLLILNTVGGDVEAGLAIAEMIASLSKPKVSIVLGGGHSIGVPMAVSADYSFIVGSATMTIHPIRMTGLVVGIPQTYDYFNKMQDRVIRFVETNSNIPSQKYQELMLRTGELANDVGTVLIGNEAVELGLIDELGGVNSAMMKLRELIKNKKKKH